MTDKSFWSQMEKMTEEPFSVDRETRFALLLKRAYEKNLGLIVSCFFDPFNPGMARQGYMDVEGRRMLVCYTSKARAKAAGYNSSWSVVRVRDSVDNMMSKESIFGMVFNPNDEKMIMVFKPMMEEILGVKEG